MREGEIRWENPIFAIDVIHNLKFMIDTGSQISIIKRECIPLEITEIKEKGEREFMGISGGAINFDTYVIIPIKLTDFRNQMKKICENS